MIYPTIAVIITILMLAWLFTTGEEPE